MIPKVSRGSSMGGLLSYLVSVDPERTANVHVAPHIVAGSESVRAWFPEGQLDHAAGLAVARELDRPRKLFGVDIPAGHVWHCSLSLKAGEGRPSDERWGEIARELMRRMDFDDPDSPKAPVRWAAIEHGLSKADNPHIHIAASLVREDGTKANPYRDYKRAQAACRVIEQQFGLVVLEGRAVGRGSRGLTGAELHRAEREGRAEPERRSLARAVRGHAAVAESEADFVRRMRAGGLLVDARFATGRDDVVAGYSVAARPGKGQKAVFFGGGHLAKDLSLPALRGGLGAQWEDSPQAASEAVAEWSRAKWRKPISRPPAAPGVDPGLWERYAGEVGVLREWLRGVPPEDTATWARVAGEASGVFAAWSAAAEGDRPGPLARAADVLARTAELPRWQVADPVPGPSLRGVARLAAQAGHGGRGVTGQALMLRQLTNVAKAIHDAQVAVAQAQAAGEIAGVARGELAVVAASLPRLELPAAQAPRPPVDRSPTPPGRRSPRPAPAPGRQRQEAER